MFNRDTEPVLDAVLNGAIARVSNHTATPEEAVKQIKDQIQEMLIYDDLTRVYTRRQALILLNLRMEEAKSNPNRELAFIMVDADDFKIINDQDQSHQTGDRMLISLANSLKRTMGDRGFVGRYGGDEFLAVAQADSGEELVKLGQELGGGVHADKVGITVSVGLAIYDPATDTEKTLVDKADKAAYKAKAEGKDGLVTEGREGFVKFSQVR